MAAHENPPVSNPQHWQSPSKAGHSEEYLSIEQLARRLPYKPKTIRNLMCQGVFLEGVHFTRLTGRPIFFWSKVEDLLRRGGNGRARQRTKLEALLPHATAGRRGEPVSRDRGAPQDPRYAKPGMRVGPRG